MFSLLKPIDGVLGVQCQIWSEYIENPSHLEYMMWPRAAALAFAAWGDGDDFMQYFNERRADLDSLGITIREIEPLRRKTSVISASANITRAIPLHL